MLRETAIVMLDYFVRFSLILFFPLLIADFCVIDRLLRWEYFHAKKAWNEEGRPHGYFWVPPESKALGGWFVSPRSSLVLRRIRVEWLFKSPEWMDVNWTNFPLNRERHYEIYVGHENGIPAYGHFIEFSFHPGYDDIESHVKKSTVEWTDAGAIFKEPSGHVLFIPKNMFIGGR